MSSKATYPTTAKIVGMVKAARSLGLDVAGFEVSRDGTIRIVEARALPKQHGEPANDFDRFADQL